MAVLIDTLAYARKLKGAGFSEEQAEALTETLAGILDERLATKQDLLELEARIEARFDAKLDAKIGGLRTELLLRIGDLERQLTLRLGAMLAFALGAMATLQAVL